jgi:hypothetical protein
MKSAPGLFLLLATLFFPVLVRATAEDEGRTEKVPIDIVETESSYVFESDLNHGISLGKQDEIQNSFEYGHRFFLKGNLYARLGVAYERFDFGSTAAPVPNHLQKIAGTISIDYMHGADIGALLQFQPGFYTENDIGADSFDCPITLARFFILQPDKLYLLVGAQAKFLRGGLPVIPFAGIVWYPSEKLHVMGILPEPRVIYFFNDQLHVWAGGQLAGGSFRIDHHNEFLNIPHVAKLSGAQVDYSEYRAGVGLTYSLINQIDLDLGAGYAIQRSFNYHRAGEHYDTDPAPYLQFEIKAKF